MDTADPWIPIRTFAGRNPNRRASMLGVAACTDARGVLTMVNIGGDGANHLVITTLTSIFDDNNVAASCMHLGSSMYTFLTFFVPPGESCPLPLLLVADYINGAVHIVDVMSKTHKGYVAAPGTVGKPCGVAAEMGQRAPSSLVAVSHIEDAAVSLHAFNAAASRWNVVRRITDGNDIHSPRGLRFTGDGSLLCVADTSTLGFLTLIRVSDGQFVRHLTTLLQDAWDVEEVEGGWIVTSYLSPVVRMYNTDGVFTGLISLGGGDIVSTLVIGGTTSVPGVGIAIHTAGGVTVLARASVAAMLRMAPARVAWMVSVVRGMAL